MPSLHFRLFTIMLHTAQSTVMMFPNTLFCFFFKPVSTFLWESGCSFKNSAVLHLKNKTSVDRWIDIYTARSLWLICKYTYQVHCDAAAVDSERCCATAALQQRHHVLSVCVALGCHGDQLVRLRENDHRVCGACRDGHEDKCRTELLYVSKHF